MGSRPQYAVTRVTVGLLFLTSGCASRAISQVGTTPAQVLAANAVDSLPHVLSAPPVQYPDSLRQAGIQGRVDIQLTVDTLGLPESGSIHVVSATRPEFQQPALLSAQGMVFTPAYAYGHKVRVLVRIPILFNLTRHIGGAAPSAMWVTDSAAPCAGLTFGWRVEAARLQALVGTHGTVAAGSDGRGLVLLFATTCPSSTIDGKATGPVALSVAIIRLQPRPDSTGGPKIGWSAVPNAYGPAGAPVTDLFRRYGYAMSAGTVTLTADSTPGARRAGFVIATPQGQVEATAQIVDSIGHFAITSALLASDSGNGGVFGGPEWAVRRLGKGTARATGVTLLSRLGLSATPDIVAYDSGFGWRFTFSSDH